MHIYIVKLNIRSWLGSRQRSCSVVSWRRPSRVKSRCNRRPNWSASFGQLYPLRRRRLGHHYRLSHLQETCIRRLCSQFIVVMTEYQTHCFELVNLSHECKDDFVVVVLLRNTSKGFQCLLSLLGTEWDLCEIWVDANVDSEADNRLYCWLFSLPMLYESSNTSVWCSSMGIIHCLRRQCVSFLMYRYCDPLWWPAVLEQVELSKDINMS